MCVTTGEHSGKAENIFSAIDSTMTNDGVDWNNLVSIGLDNTNSNMGIRNSIKSRILQKNSDVFVAGCSCHLAHLAAGAGGQAYQSVTDFDMEDHQVDMYYFFKNSTRRKGIRARNGSICPALSKHDGCLWRIIATKNLRSFHL